MIYLADIWNQTTPTTNVAMQQNGECFFMRQYSHFPLNNVSDYITFSKKNCKFVNFFA